MALNGLGDLKIQPLAPETGAASGKKEVGEKGLFSSQLEGLLKDPSGNIAEKANLPLTVKFSNHAVERMRSRGIHFPQETLQKLEDVVQRAKEKGAKETLVMADNAAMILNIENKTVVTVMDKNMLKENIFTKIDAAVII
jgi:flagellar operon protein